MEVSNSPGRIEKFSGRPSTISLREFRVTFSTMVCELELKYGANYTKAFAFSLREFGATFSTMVCELELKYGANYTEAFAFKQLAHYVYYEALNVYKQHFLRILGVTRIPNLAYVTTIATTSQVALQATIAHHGTMPNNPNLVLTLVNFSSQ